MRLHRAGDVDEQEHAPRLFPPARPGEAAAASRPAGQRLRRRSSAPRLPARARKPTRRGARPASERASRSSARQARSAVRSGGRSAPLGSAADRLPCRRVAGKRLKHGRRRFARRVRLVGALLLRRSASEPGSSGKTRRRKPRRRSAIRRRAGRASPAPPRDISARVGTRSATSGRKATVWSETTANPDHAGEPDVGKGPGSRRG